jgi:hypothetical protein
MTSLSDLVPTVAQVNDLTDLERDLLAFEHLTWRHAGSRDTAIRERFDMTPTRYHQLLNALIDRPAALAHDPVTVKRLRRLREQRRPWRRAG